MKRPLVLSGSPIQTKIQRLDQPGWVCNGDTEALNQTSDAKLGRLKKKQYRRSAGRCEPSSIQYITQKVARLSTSDDDECSKRKPPQSSHQQYQNNNNNNPTGCSVLKASQAPAQSTEMIPIAPKPNEQPPNEQLSNEELERRKILMAKIFI